jgi:hypothetical protein
MAIISQDSQSAFNDKELTHSMTPSKGRVHDNKYTDWKRGNIGARRKIQPQIPNIHFT